MRKIAIITFVIFTCLFLSCKDEKIVVRTSIVGSWICEEINQTNGTRRTYIVDIDRKTDDTVSYLLSNFYNVDPEQFVYANLHSKKLTISAMPVGFTQIIVNLGTGIVSDDYKRIDFEYTIFDGQNYTIKALYTRP